MPTTPRAPKPPAPPGVHERRVGRRKSDIVYKSLSIVLIPVLLLLLVAYLYLLYSHTTPPAVTAVPLAPLTIEKINSIVNNHPNVSAIQVITVDMKRNSRTIIHSASTDSEMQRLYSRFVANYGSREVPFFTNDDINNARMLRILNHEFVCSPYKETISYKYAPEAALVVSTVCTVGVPPSFGSFVGMVGVFLKNPPTMLEQDQLRIILKNISVQLLDDLKPAP